MHRFVERTPVVTTDYRTVDEILARNARIAAKESVERKKQDRRK